MIVKGRLQVRKWTDTSGNSRRSTEVVAESIYFGDSKREGGTSTGSYASPAYSAPDVTATPGEFTMMDADDSDLPF